MVQTVKTVQTPNARQGRQNRMPSTKEQRYKVFLFPRLILTILQCLLDVEMGSKTPERENHTRGGM